MLIRLGFSAILLSLAGACAGPAAREAASAAPASPGPALGAETLAKLAEAWADGGKAMEREDWSTAGWAFERVLAIDPGEEVARHLAAVSRARIDARTDTLEHLRKLRDAGSDLVPTAAELGPLGEDPEVIELLAELRAVARSSAGAPVALTIDEPDLYPEGIAFDPVSGDFLLGSLHRRQILRVTPRADAPPRLVPLVGPAADGLGAVAGLRVDAERRQLWAATGMIPLAAGFEEAERGRSRLCRFHLDSGAIEGCFEPPADGSEHQLNDIAVDAGGNAWVTDTFTGALYRLRAGGDALEAALPAGTFLWPNGIAADGAGGGLWVADWRSGVTYLDLVTGRRSRLDHPAGVSIHGFDGLYVHDGDLVGILNPVQPARVVRLRLAEGEPRVVAQEILVARHPRFGIPTTGAIEGGAIWVIADSQMRRVDPDGRALPAAELRPIEILRVELESP